MTLADVHGATSPIDIIMPALSRRAIRERQRAAKAADLIVADVDIIADTGAGPDAGTIQDAGTGTIPDAGTRAVPDAFATASRAFRAVTGEQPVVIESPAAGATALPAEATAAHVAARGSRSRRKLVAAGATLGIMGIAGLLAVSTTLPAEAVAAVQGESVQAATSLVAAKPGAASDVSGDEIQAFVASSDVQNHAIRRDEDYSTLSLGDLAAEQGIAYSDSVYTNDPSAAIQWPFIVGVGMSYGYGMRDGRLHEGLDLVPGAGAPVQAIADGTVRIATESGGNYGVTVYIDHIIDGALITSHYSHMQYGSLRFAQGDTVKVGDIIGLVGNTGRSYGAHMHFELIVNDSTIDPLPWLQKNAGRMSY